MSGISYGIAGTWTIKINIIYIFPRERIWKWRARKRPPLDPEIAERLAWAKDWTEEDFEEVIWSGECSVERGKTVWVYNNEIPTSVFKSL